MVNVVYIRGPIALFGNDNGIFCVEKDAGVRFIAETRLPVPLLVEHDSTLQIGQVFKLQVDDAMLVASCVVDESLFISVVSSLQQCGHRYQSLNIGNFLNILFPSLSSYHMTGTFAIREISVVDVGRREGTLWCVDSQPQQWDVQFSTRRMTITLKELLIKLLYLVFRQRQQPNRREHLCRQANICGRSTDFVSASSLSPLGLSTIEGSEDMAKSGNAVLRSDLKMLLRKHASSESENDHSKDCDIDGSTAPTYTAGEVLRMLKNLEQRHAKRGYKKQMDQAKLHKAMEKTLERREGNNMRQITKFVDTSSSDDDGAYEDKSVDHSYTSMPINRRILNMMKKAEKKNAIKETYKRKRQSVTRMAKDGSDTDDSDDSNDGEKRGKQRNADKVIKQMDEGIKQIVSMLTPKQVDGQAVTAPMNTSDSHVVANTVHATDKHKGGSEVKSSALLDSTQSDTVDHLFS